MSNKQVEQWYPIYLDNVLITETDTEELCKYIFTKCFTPATSTNTNCQDQKHDINE